MPERVTEFSITARIETTKRTISHSFDNVTAFNDWVAERAAEFPEDESFVDEESPDDEEVV